MLTFLMFLFKPDLGSCGLQESRPAAGKQAASFVFKKNRINPKYKFESSMMKC